MEYEISDDNLIAHLRARCALMAEQSDGKLTEQTADPVLWAAASRIAELAALTGISIVAEDMTAAVIRASRKRMGMTQADLGKCAGVSRKHIVEIENGSAPISRRTAAAIAMVFMGSGLP